MGVKHGEHGAHAICMYCALCCMFNGYGYEKTEYNSGVVDML